MFVDMVKDVEASKKLDSIVTELFLRGRNSTFCLFLFHNLIFKCLNYKT